MDSPRGRIYLIRAHADKRLPLTARLVHHLDLCLDCRACETACPSGVRYGRLLEGTREHLTRAWRRPVRERILGWMIRSVFPYPGRLRALLAPAYLVRRLRAERLLPSFLRHLMALLPPSLPRARPLPETVPAQGPRRLRVGFLAGCAARVLCPEMNAAIVSVLSRNGCEVLIPRQQACCGALHLHTGDREAARQLARRNIDAFLPLNPDVIVPNAAGCGAAMKEYGDLLADDPEYASRAQDFARRVRDFTEVATELDGLQRGLGPLPQQATYHDACHLAHAQGIRTQPRALLAAVPGLRTVNLPESDWCCGSAGVYNILHPEMAWRILDRKLDNIERTGAELVVAANPGCLLQIRAGVRRRGLSIEVLHPAEVLERSYQAGGRA